MPYYRKVGEVPRTRHTQFRRPDGNLYAEEYMGMGGFDSDWSLLYHREIPTVLTAVNAVEIEPDPLEPNRPLKPRHLRSRDLKAGGDAIMGRHLLLGNMDVCLSYVAADQSSDLYRNAVGDELFYIQAGGARLESVFGCLEVRSGDYVIIPAVTTHRWVINDEPLEAVVIEGKGHIAPPPRYLTSRGQFAVESPYCERDLRVPEGPFLADGTEVDVIVKQGAGLTRYTYAMHPFDVVGWDGCLYPYAFNVEDFEPATGRIIKPPPVYEIFEGTNFVVRTFVPRVLAWHPEAVPIPYNHANVDRDEVLFYAKGPDYARSGSGIETGSITLHPAGHIHGPQPGAVEASIGEEFTEELLIMMDAFSPLELGPSAYDCEDPDYFSSWARQSRTLQE